jgi:hypothetical protein
MLVPMAGETLMLLRLVRAVWEGAMERPVQVMRMMH